MKTLVLAFTHILFCPAVFALQPWALVGNFEFKGQVHVTGVWHREVLRTQVPAEVTRAGELKSQGFDCLQTQGSHIQCRKYLRAGYDWSSDKVVLRVKQRLENLKFQFGLVKSANEIRGGELYREWDIEQDVIVRQNERESFYQFVRYAKLQGLIKMYPGQDPTQSLDYLVMQDEGLMIPSSERETINSRVSLEWTLEAVVE